MENKKITIEFEIPGAAVQAGAIEAFAESYGWRAKIYKMGEDSLPTRDSKGDFIMIDNPISAEDYGVKVVKDEILARFKDVFVKNAKKEAAKQAQDAVESLLG